MREPLSIAIIARNSAAQLPPCLESVRFADDVVVVDSGSEDDTVAVAERHGARVVTQTWLGYGKQKQHAVALAKHRWVLCIDTDERVSDALRESIERALTAPPFRAYRMPRRNRFMGRWLRHGEGYPDWSLRLFDREHARWSDDTIHEKVVTQTPIGTLRGDLLHESETTIEDYLAKQNRYTTLQAEALYARGKRAGLGKLLINPVVRFIKFYFLKCGFLDGKAGLVHIAIGCFNTFCKYAKLAQLHARGKD